MFKGVEPTKYIALAYLTGILPVKKLKTAIIAMLSGNEVRVKTTTFQNDMVTFRNKDDVLTLLIHLGYLAYNQQEQTAYIPNEEIFRRNDNQIKKRQFRQIAGSGVLRCIQKVTGSIHSHMNTAGAL